MVYLNLILTNAFKPQLLFPQKELFNTLMKKQCTTLKKQLKEDMRLYKEIMKAWDNIITGK
jgi:hypothetical protein